MPLPRAALLLTILCAVTVGDAHAIDYEYDWTGGTSGFAGKIVLDSDSNTSGTVANIVSAQITTSLGTFDFDSSTAFLVQPKFAWNPSQITDMWIEWALNVPSAFAANAGFGENYNGTGINYLDSFIHDANGVRYDADFNTGSWTAAASSSVPDATSTGLLFTLGMSGLIVMKKKRTLG